MRLNFRGPLADAGLRTAVGKLIDNDQIMAAAFPDDPGATHFMPDDSPLYDEQAVWPDKDVDGARKLVDEYRAAHGGADITLTYVTTAGSPVLNRVAELLQSQIQQVDGLKLDIKSLDGAGFASAMTSGNYDLIISSLGGAHPENLYKVFRTGAAGNNSGYSNPVVDQAFEITHSSSDPAVVNEAYKTAIRQIVADSAYRFWRPSESTLLSAASVQDVQPPTSTGSAPNSPGSGSRGSDDVVDSSIERRQGEDEKGFGGCCQADRGADARQCRHVPPSRDDSR